MLSYVDERWSKSGKLVVPEYGGATSSKGSAQLVGNYLGKPLKPIWVGRKAFCEQGIFIFRPGMIIAQADRYHDTTRVWVGRFTGDIQEVDPNYVPMGTNNRILQFETLLEWRDNEQEFEEIDDWLKPIVMAAIEKTHCYHCRHTHYAETEGSDQRWYRWI